MPIRIMHVVDTWAVGGLQNGLANLIDRMDAERFEHIICPMRPVDESNTHRIPSAARVLSLSRQESARRFQVPALMRKISQVQPDIVHTRNWGTFDGMLAARLLGGCARVHSEHGIDWDSTTKEPKRRVICRRLAFQFADRVLSVSEHLRELHARRTGFPERRIEVIHNGVDSQRFAPDPAVRVRVRRELGIADAEFCIGSVGNLIPVKDHLTLLGAAGIFARQGRPWRLLIAGDGPERDRLTAAVNSHPEWKDRIIFLGRHAAVRELLNALDVYVLSSLTEGISNSLLEAMATGVSVIATETGGNPEVIVHGESGLLFPVGDDGCLAKNLTSLEAMPDWRLRIGQGALRRVRERFSMDSMVARYEGVYRNLGAAAVIVDRAVART